LQPARHPFRLRAPGNRTGGKERGPGEDEIEGTPAKRIGNQGRERHAADHAEGPAGEHDAERAAFVPGRAGYRRKRVDGRQGHTRGDSKAELRGDQHFRADGCPGTGKAEHHQQHGDGQHALRPDAVDQLAERKRTASRAETEGRRSDHHGLHARAESPCHGRRYGAERQRIRPDETDTACQRPDDGRYSR